MFAGSQSIAEELHEALAGASVLNECQEASYCEFTEKQKRPADGSRASRSTRRRATPIGDARPSPHQACHFAKKLAAATSGYLRSRQLSQCCDLWKIPD
jgi:hypothetical protein